MLKNYYPKYATVLLLLSIIFLNSFHQPTVINSKEALGEKLFFDPILSKDKSISCASCHKPEFAFADTLAFSIGVGGKLTTRNTPSAMNMSMRSSFFSDGRAKTLEEQAKGPIENANEMNLHLDSAFKRVFINKEYQTLFQKIYKKKVSQKLILDAIASFEKTLETGNTPYDKFANGDTLAITLSAKRGKDIFIGKGKCFDCHFGVDFTGDEFKNIGLYNKTTQLNDIGRGAITKKQNDYGSFKVPGLRNVEITKPYMHNGMFATLKEVIEYYNTPEKFVQGAINRDTLVRNLDLTSQEKEDLEQFLLSLTDIRFKKK
jgi:cytochrome c peroxidase